MARSAEIWSKFTTNSSRFSQICAGMYIAYVIKAPSVDIGIHQIEESPLRDGLFFIAKSQQPFINAV